MSIFINVIFVGNNSRVRLGATGVSSAFMYAAHLLCGSFLLFRRIEYDIYDILMQKTAGDQRQFFRIRRTQHKDI